MGDTWHGEEIPRLNRTTYLTPRGIPRSGRSSSNRRAWDASGGCDYSQSRSADRHRTVQRRRGRTSRSSRDRGAIEPWSRRNRAAIARILPRNRSHSSWRWSMELQEHDRRPIKARSGGNRGQSWRKSWPFWRLIWSPIRADFSWNWSHDAAPKDSFPRRLQTKPTTASIGHVFGPNFLFKTMYFPSLFFNFWSTREEIKRVSRKVLSSRDPLLPRV